MVNDLPKAEEHLVALKQICVVACEEADDLEKAIATHRTRRSTSSGVVPVSAPPGTEALAVDWVNVTAPGGGTMLAAVARPSGAGPFPAVVILHGTHGFAQEYVRLARDLASRGVLAVAACWFAGSSGAGARFVTPISCTEAPPLAGAVSAEAWQRVDALVHATRGLPGVRRDRIALFGHSRGAGAALNYSLGGGPVQAAVLNSSGYPSTFAALAARAKAPVLMLHGTADSPADGGSELSNVRMARDFEAALRAAGKPVETMYYEGGRHNGLFSDPAQYQDELQRTATFLLRHLQR
jgi:dienelactone hydrolase